MSRSTDSGTVWWLTGLPGAGKTTLARILRDRLTSYRRTPVLLDGDELRAILGAENNAYGTQDRQKLAYFYARLCRYLSSQGFDVICATVSLFSSIHHWNRENIDHYIEVLIQAPSGVLQERDQKGLYSGAEGGTSSDVPGVDLHVEFPKAPDLIIDNDGSRSPEELVERLLAYLMSNREATN